MTGQTGLTPALLRSALRIRRAEERLLELYAEGGISGTVHCCLGQELIGAVVGDLLTEGDTVFSNHRGHGHFLGFQGGLVELFGEVLGRRVGAVRGLGGSQHLHRGGFYSGGILGGLLPVAAGSAMGHRLRGGSAIAVAFLGDGTFGEGILYETFNLAARWELPVLFVVEDNQVAQSTPASVTRAGSLDRRAEAFGIPVLSTDCWDPDALTGTAAKAVEEVRSGPGPVVLLIQTYRLAPHSKGDDHRDPAEIATAWSRDLLQGRLQAADPLLIELDRQVRIEVADAVAVAQAAPVLDVAELTADPLPPAPLSWQPVMADGRRWIGALREGFDDLLAHDERVLLLGEDIEDPYGGAFKVTAGLSSAYPGRVRNTPISEAAIVGLGSGLALAGHRVLVEIMFGDFITLALDQLVNQAAKLRSLYRSFTDGRLIVRTPMGGYRGYGPTHSQSLERHLIGVPGLRVVALNSLLDPAEVYRELVAQEGDPTIVLEHKLLYGRRLGAGLPEGFVAERSAGPLPVVRVHPSGVPDVTLIGYGGMLDDLLVAADRMFVEDDLLAQVICPSRIYPFDARELVPLMAPGQSLVVVEEGQGFAGFGAELLAQLSQHAPDPGRRVARVHAAATVIPAAAALERAVLPSVDSIMTAARGVAGAR